MNRSGRLKLMNILSGFADVSLAQLALVAGVAFFASVVGGVSGYGTGALMPLVLVPLVGPAPVVPIIAISALFGAAIGFLVRGHLANRSNN